jgi:predicted metalloprotease
MTEFEEELIKTIKETVAQSLSAKSKESIMPYVMKIIGIIALAFVTTLFGNDVANANRDNAISKNTTSIEDERVARIQYDNKTEIKFESYTPITTFNDTWKTHLKIYDYNIKIISREIGKDLILTHDDN